MLKKGLLIDGFHKINSIRYLSLYELCWVFTACHFSCALNCDLYYVYSSSLKSTIFFMPSKLFKGEQI